MLPTTRTNAAPNFSRIFKNEEFGFYSADILRPLRLRVNLDENIFAAVKDSELVTALKKFKKIFGDKFYLDYNSFILELEKFIILNKKNLKVLRDNFIVIDENAAPVTKGDGSFKSDNNLKDIEQIPLTYAGDVETFLKNDIKPFVPDAWIDKKSVVIGYEITFTKYFYKSAELRTPAEIISDIKADEISTANLLADIVKEF